MKRILLSLLLILIVMQADVFADWVTNSNKKESKAINSKLTNKVTDDLIKSTNTIKEVEKEKELLEPVGFINSYKKSNDIFINWDDAAADSYNIYRSINIISNQDILKKSELLGNVKKRVQNYTDKNISSSGNYYYAIVNFNNNKEDIVLITDSNYTTVPVVFSKPKVIKKPEVKPEVKPEIKKVKKTEPVPVKQKVIIKKEPKKVVKKVKKIIKKRKKIDYTLWLNNSVKKYFINKDFIRSIQEFNKIISSKASVRVKMKARLFLGRTYYEIKNYKKALKQFALTEDLYPDESDFWIQKASREFK